MSENGKTLVITGASSGIGDACVSRMSRAGWRVFATVRKQSDRERLGSENNVCPVIMDVQNQATISAAAAEIAAQLKGGGLDGLVNVAGVGMVRPLEYAPIDDVREIFEINFFGLTSVGVNLAIPFGGIPEFE